MNPVFAQGYNNPSYILVDQNMLYYNPLNQHCIIPFSNPSSNANANFDNIRDPDQVQINAGNKKNVKSEKNGLESNNLSNANKNINSAQKNPGRWSQSEHQKFIKGLQLHGKNWPKIEQIVGNRTSSQIRSHAQKFFYKLQKKFGDADPIEIVRSEKLKELYPKILNQIDDSENSQAWEKSSSKKQDKNKGNLSKSKMNKSHFIKSINENQETRKNDKLLDLITNSIRILNSQNGLNENLKIKLVFILKELLKDYSKISDCSLEEIINIENELSKAFYPNFENLNFFTNFLESKKLYSEKNFVHLYKNLGDWFFEVGQKNQELSKNNIYK